MTFARPKKNDLDTALSMLMHSSRHKLLAEVNQIKSDAIKNGALQSNRVVVAAVKAADDIHKEAAEQANAMLLDFIERMQCPPSQVIEWARPHLENMSNSILGAISPDNFPADHQRLTNQYWAVFQQRMDILLRNVEIGHQNGTGFARAEKMESNEEWVSAAEAVRLLAPKFSEYSAKMNLCKRAHAGMIRTRAERFVLDNRPKDNFELPPVFWWAEGHEALTQDWRSGDFDTWVESHKLANDLRFAGGKIHLQAFNVSFLRSQVEKLNPPDGQAAPVEATKQPATRRNKGGRPRHEFWEELLVEIGRQLYDGVLKPKTQADIEAAMKQWLINQGYEAGDTAVRERAQMYWVAIQKDEN
ncbi:hypothetical protein [Bradyrhizobium sp. SZCCHNS2005]|uniref:hypothetical protein n=1 Tax=Bradyrhizobium sp. SZCCHNS2005 TaxID=3057303 RepID=UPI0028E876C7|nr:hypothetical protein [Bradyrhizobium sp. SZCCHNS2005]